MAYEKAEYWAAYRRGAVLSNNWKMAKFRSPQLEGLVDYDPSNGVTLAEHYVPNAIKPFMPEKAQKVIDHFAQTTPLTATSTVIVIGGAYGWLGEALEDLVPGLEAISVDLSQYVQDTKSLSPDDELIESIAASGYDHTLPNSVGEWLYNELSDPSPRSRRPEMVIQSDMSKTKARNDIRKTFQREVVTHVVTEEVWQILTAEEQTRYTAAATGYGAVLAHIIDGAVI